MNPQLFMGKEKPLKDKMLPISDREHWIKPFGGLWTSTYRPETNDSDWIEWCQSEMPEWINDDRWILTPKAEARVVTVDSLNDFKKLFKRYGEYQIPGVSSLAFLSFEAMMEEYDAMHLTERGESETRFARPGLYGWDCESTIWFRWMFESVEYRSAKPAKRLIQLED